MNFDSEPSAVSSSEGGGVTGSENEPVWKRCSLICLDSISSASACDAPCQCPRCSEIMWPFSALPKSKARSIQDGDGLLNTFLGSIGEGVVKEK
jgi:hypothetical protein